MLEIVDPVDWEKSPVLQDQGIFLQSALQKRLCESLGQSTWLFRHAGVRALVTKVQARRGTFFFLPYGPLLVDDLEKTSLKSF
ncbi:MAG: hypothetical protein Q8P95_03965, partial [bacterium]|nr:hypothetical protein [bacterium]